MKLTMQFREECIIKDGYLNKSPPEEKLHKRWRRRYFILYDPNRKITDQMFDQKTHRLHTPLAAAKSCIEPSAGTSLRRRSASMLRRTKSEYVKKKMIVTPIELILCYFEKEEKKRMGEMPIKQLELTNAIVKDCLVPTDSKYPYIIELQTTTRTMYLCAETKTEHENWLEALLSVTTKNGDKIDENDENNENDKTTKTDKTDKNDTNSTNDKSATDDEKDEKSIPSSKDELADLYDSKQVYPSIPPRKKPLGHAKSVKFNESPSYRDEQNDRTRNRRPTSLILKTHEHFTGPLSFLNQPPKQSPVEQQENSKEEKDDDDYLLLGAAKSTSKPNKAVPLPQEETTKDTPLPDLPIQPRSKPKKKLDRSPTFIDPMFYKHDKITVDGKGYVKSNIHLTDEQVAEFAVGYEKMEGATEQQNEGEEDKEKEEEKYQLETKEEEKQRLNCASSSRVFRQPRSPTTPPSPVQNGVPYQV